MILQKWFRVLGFTWRVSVSRCAGVGSTQARTPTCMSPPSLALHPCLDLRGFWVLSNSDRAPVAFCFFHPSVSKLGLARRLSSLEQLDVSKLCGCKVCVWVRLGASSFLQTGGGGLVWIWACFEACRPAGTRFGFGSGWRPLVLFSHLNKRNRLVG